MKNKIKETTHSFEVEDVKKYGSIEKALIMKEIRSMNIYKIRNNLDPWVYYSRRALAEKFPYMSHQSIGRWLKELERDGHLLSRIDNKFKYDKTKSYLVKELEPFAQKRIHVAQNEPPLAQNEPTIPPHSSPLTDNTSSKNNNKNNNLLFLEEGRKSQSSYGNKEINELIEFFKKQLGGSLDGSVRQNRRFAYLLINKFKKDYPDKDPIEGIKFLIQIGLKDDFHSKNLTNFKYLYYNAQKIIQSFKGRLNKIAIIKTK